MLQSHQLRHNIFGGFLAVSHFDASHCCLSSIVIPDDYRELIGKLATVASMELDDVVMVIYLLTLDFKLAFLAVVLEVDKESDDASKQHRSNGSTSDARCFKHHARSSGCCGKEQKVNKLP